MTSPPASPSAEEPAATPHWVWADNSTGFSEVRITARSGREGATASFSWRLQQGGPQNTCTWTYEWGGEAGGVAVAPVPTTTTSVPDTVDETGDSGSTDDNLPGDEVVVAPPNPPASGGGGSGPGTAVAVGAGVAALAGAGATVLRRRPAATRTGPPSPPGSGPRGQPSNSTQERTRPLPQTDTGEAGDLGVLDPLDEETERGTFDPLDEEEAEDDEDESRVSLELTHPAGRSPFVFQYEWIFGARCIVDGPSGQPDLSDQVKWSGTAKFIPPAGRVSRPEFESGSASHPELSKGARTTGTITLTVDVDGRRTERTFPVAVVSAYGYAAVSHISKNPADAHGCPACPHPVQGPITTGSPNVTVAGLPAARVGDIGVATPCCGPGSFAITSGDPSVLINGKPAAMKGSTTSHCGGTGRIINAWSA